LGIRRKINANQNCNRNIRENTMNGQLITEQMVIFRTQCLKNKLYWQQLYILNVHVNKYSNLDPDLPHTLSDVVYVFLKNGGTLLHVEDGNNLKFFFPSINRQWSF
jgi:hypothetical protein